MYAFKKLAITALASVAMTGAAMNCAVAQSDSTTDATQPDSQRAKQTSQAAQQGDKTAPQAASSPHQREATSTAAAEAPANANAEPASSSSPHQRQTTKTANAKGEQKDEMLNECIGKQQKADANMSKDQAKRACMDQRKKAETPAG